MPRFYEHYYWTYGNEYLNTITSFIMTVFGIMGLLKSNYLIITNILSHIWILLILNNFFILISSLHNGIYCIHLSLSLFFF